MIARLAAKRVQPAQLTSLRALVKRMQAAARLRDPDAYFPLNLEFHDTLAQAAGNAALLANYRRVIRELNLYRRATLARTVDNIPVATRDHEAIVNAVAKGDEKLAERLLYDHVISSRDRLNRALKQTPVSANPKNVREAA